jgi:hypothetical protein
MTSAQVKTALAVGVAGTALTMATYQKRMSTAQLLILVGFGIAQWVATSAQLDRIGHNSVQP